LPEVSEEADWQRCLMTEAVVSDGGDGGEVLEMTAAETLWPLLLLLSVSVEAACCKSLLKVADGSV
jgi:hypothetical protein